MALFRVFQKNCKNLREDNRRTQTECGYIRSDPLLIVFSKQNHVLTIEVGVFLFCFFTDELSMNPRVRSSPYSPPPADELILSKNDVFNTRRRRLFFLSIHLLALAGLYLCVTCQVKLYTVLFGKTFASNPMKCLTFPAVSFAIKRLELILSCFLNGQRKHS